MKNIFKDGIAPFILSVLASWVYDIFKQKGIFPASPKLIDIILGGLVFFAILIIQRRSGGTSNVGQQMSWVEFFDRIGVITQKIFIGFGISAIIITVAYFASVKFILGKLLEDLNSGAIAPEQYTVVLGVEFPLIVLGGIVSCLLAGQAGVFTKIFGDKLYSYEEIRPLDERNSIKEIPYRIRIELAKNAFWAAIFGCLLGAATLGPIFIEVYNIYNLYQNPASFLLTH